MSKIKYYGKIQDPKDLITKEYTDINFITTEDAVPSQPVNVNANTLDNHSASYFATAEQLSDKVDKETGKGLFSGNYDDLSNKPSIPSRAKHLECSQTSAHFDGDNIEVALDSLYDMADGKYSKPSGGIPKSDLASAVQASLDKADSALQSHQSLSAYRPASAQDTIDAGKQDKITSSNKLAYSLISGTPTIPTVPTNVSAFNNDSGYLTLSTLPIYDGSVV